MGGWGVETEKGWGHVIQNSTETVKGGGGGNCGNLVIPVHLTCTIYWDAKKERGAHSMF